MRYTLNKFRRWVICIYMPTILQYWLPLEIKSRILIVLWFQIKRLHKVYILFRSHTAINIYQSYNILFFSHFSFVLCMTYMMMKTSTLPITVLLNSLLASLWRIFELLRIAIVRINSPNWYSQEPLFSSHRVVLA